MTFLARFEALFPFLPTLVLKCYVPQEGDFLRSNNVKTP